MKIYEKGEYVGQEIHRHHIETFMAEIGRTVSHFSDTLLDLGYDEYHVEGIINSAVDISVLGSRLRHMR